MSATIMFLCPHGAAKSVIAAAYFNRLAQQHGLPHSADAAGTEPDDVVSPAVVNLLHDEGIDVSQHQPRTVSRDELEQAQRVISLGCELADLEIAPQRVEQWLDVPFVSKDLQGAAQTIHTHVEQLIDTLLGDVANRS